MGIADRVVVLAKSAVAAEQDISGTSEGELANLMVGRELPERRYQSVKRAGNTMLEISGLTVKNDRNLHAVQDVSLKIASGEILGLARRIGQRGSVSSRRLFGLRSPYQVPFQWTENRSLRQIRGSNRKRHGPYSRGQDDHGTASGALCGGQHDPRKPLPVQKNRNAGSTVCRKTRRPPHR